jgi:hypothetical protein
MNLNDLLKVAGVRTDKASVEERKKLQRQLTAEQELEVQERAAAMAKSMLNGVMPALHQALNKTAAPKPEKTIIIPDEK